MASDTNCWGMTSILEAFMEDKASSSDKEAGESSDRDDDGEEGSMEDVGGDRDGVVNNIPERPVMFAR